MARFKTKPFEVDAVRFDGSNTDELVEFTKGQFDWIEPEDRPDDPDITAQVFDKLHSTWVGVKDGQWIIRGGKGEYYPCDNEVFEAKYEQVSSTPRVISIGGESAEDRAARGGGDASRPGAVTTSPGGSTTKLRGVIE